MKFIVWAVLLFALMFLAQMIVPIPIAVLVHGRAAAQAPSPALADSRPILTARPRQGAAALLYGLLVGGGLAFAMSTLTWRWVSSHWLPSFIVALGFFVTAGAGQRLAIGRAMYEEGAGKLVAAMFGGYMWGGLLGLLIFRVMKWIA